MLELFDCTSLKGMYQAGRRGRGASTASQWLGSGTGPARSLFLKIPGLQEKLIINVLTNTYLTSQAQESILGPRGHSKFIFSVMLHLF